MEISEERKEIIPHVVKNKKQFNAVAAETDEAFAVVSIGIRSALCADVAVVDDYNPTATTAAAAGADAERQKQHCVPLFVHAMFQFPVAVFPGIQALGQTDLPCCVLNK